MTDKNNLFPNNYKILLQKILSTKLKESTSVSIVLAVHVCGMMGNHFYGMVTGQMGKVGNSTVGN